MPEMLEEMTPWVQNESLKYKETIIEGFENLSNALICFSIVKHGKTYSKSLKRTNYP